MKKLSIVLLLASILGGLTACGPSQDDPEKKHRDAGLVPVGSDKAAKGTEKEKIVVIKEVPVEVPKYYPDEDPELVVNENLYQVINENLTFVEGESKSYDLKVKITHGEVNFKVEAAMAGLTFTEVKREKNLNTYKVSYAPKSGTVPGNDFQVEGVFKLKLTDLQFVSKDAKVNENSKAAFDAISKTREVPFRVIRTNKKPTIKVVGLDSKTVISEGSVVPFSVEVTAPGASAGNEPVLDDYYTRRNALTENGFEAKGAIYVEEDPSKPRVEKISDNTWKFNFVVNARDYFILPPLDKNMKPVVNPTRLYLREAFKAYTAFTAPSDEKVVQFSIVLKPKATTVVPGGN